MALTSMLNNNVVNTNEAAPVSTMAGEKYPWGLRITLNGPELDKLNLDVQDFQVGSDFDITVRARVTEVRSTERENDLENNDLSSNDKSVSLQITDLEVINPNDFNNAFKDAIQSNDE